MFEAAELGQKVSKKAFNDAEPDLRVELVEAQQALRKADFPVLIILAGVDGAGKSELARLLNEWMDPRWIVTRAYGPPTEWEKSRPEFWRYWVDLPQRGHIGIYLSAWYSDPLVERAYGRLSLNKLDRSLDRIANFEQTLADDGALILKYWMHLDKAAQKKRLEKLEQSPEQHWKITKRDWKNWERYDKFITTAEHIIRRTSSGTVPWRIIDGSNARYRSLTVLTELRDAITRHIESRVQAAIAPGVGVPVMSSRAVAPDDTTVLSMLDLRQSVRPKIYSREMRRLRARLNALYLRAKKEKLATMLVFEGWDAAGKGGTIHRITSALDARDYRIHPFAAPNDIERAHHYLWRFWQHVPHDGKFAIFDRSWYGRVLVERVDGLASESEWQRAYAEINEFESQLVDHGILLVKYWLHIDKEEQLQRFERRSEIPFKSWKLTEEDWRNRENWDAYAVAVNEMVERTSTAHAPWVLVEANDKRFARLKVMRTLCDALEKRLG